jgi:beta-glucosidase
MKRILFFFISVMSAISAFAQNYPYQDPSLSPEERADDLLGRLSVEQKIMLMDYDSPEIPEFGIRKYNWWNEALH